MPEFYEYLLSVSMLTLLWVRRSGTAVSLRGFTAQSRFG